MKKLILLSALAGFILTSCGSKQEDKKEGSEDAYHEYESAENGASSSSSSASSAVPEAEQEPVPMRDLIAQGEALINSSDCKTCHTVENRIVGPSYNDVAGKYSFTKENVAMLAGKIITGGAGNWGEIPMTAHVGLSQADSEKMVYYILSLDGEDYQE